MKQKKRQYRDSIFVDLFSKDIHAKENALSLYNALHNTNLQLEDTDVQFLFLEGTVYTGIRNDVAFMVNNTVLMLCEHQSTINENMPLRFFFYAAHLYEKLIDERARFEKKMHPIAKPEFYVFYNGKQNLPSVSTLNISDAFLQKDDEPPIELKVTVFNLNELAPQLAKSKTLQEYATFVKIVEEMKTEDEDSFTQAIERCIKEGILSDYLKRNTKEVHNMFFGEYDREMDIRVQRAEERKIALAEGMQQGISVGVAEGSRTRNIEIARNFKNMGLPVEQIVQGTGLSLEEVQAL